MSAFDPESIDVVACDVFGTTVDWYSGVRDTAAEVFGPLGVDLDTATFADDWRAMYLPALEQVESGARPFANLDVLHRESLDRLLDGHGVDRLVGNDARERLVRAWHRLPAWPDAAEGLARLRGRYVVATLSNGGLAMQTRLMKTTGLPFDCILSADMMRTYKPALQTYRGAATLLDMDPARILMVAAHGWDIDGARGAGLRTAFLERPQEKGPHRNADRADDTTSDLAVTSFIDLAQQLGC
ncbi:haloacid dehalogenase type II [Nocardia sp. ET3-3]|uniref:Haloacid dehalogenase type II n=1 Tax=Nocardia terrae TaxID=2675851 RepID=A0A7K1US65_9NOCA|nr:haloacid dehalogenase type II [Nocardia terrae]MVU77177.1 haloacid dehalogenase type II [Nocardia terrae]